MKGVLILRNKKITIYSFLVVLIIPFILFGLYGVSISTEETAVKKDVKKAVTQQKGKNNPYANAKISTQIIPSINKTFGYDILLNGKPLVHQPSIPAMPGNDGFTSKEKAQKVADFVVKKIRKNEMPPTVTIEDLNKMGVLKKD
jgi:hypothetical protein